MRKMLFYNKDKNKNTQDLLSSALANRKQTVINQNTVSQPAISQQREKTSGGNTLRNAIRVGKGLKNLYDKGQQNGWFDFGKSQEPSLLSMNDYTSAFGENGFADIDKLSFINSAPSNIDSLSFLNSGTTKPDNLSFMNMGGESAGGFMGGGGGTPWGLIGKIAKTGYNGITGQNDTDYSDTEETIAYPLQGASMGASFGPWGAAGGALYGLGYSFKDDIGLDDNEFLTDIIFPIGMGDEHKGIMGLFGG